MGAPGPARALAQVMTIAFAALIYSPAFAAYTHSARPRHETVPSLDRRADLEAPHNPEAVRLAAIDPSVADFGRSQSESAEPFGRIALQAPEGGLWRKWRGVQRDIEREAEVLARCRANSPDCPSEPARRFLAIIEHGQARQGRARLGEINRAINLAIRPMSDFVQYGVLDVWTSPLATLAAGAGDCEDYAIAKYVALRETGVDERDLRLLVVRDTKLGEEHAVVAARLDGHWLVLDNRRLVLLEDMQLAQYVPTFEIDGGGVKRLESSEAVLSSIRNDPNPAPPASGPPPGTQ